MLAAAIFTYSACGTTRGACTLGATTAASTAGGRAGAAVAAVAGREGGGAAPATGAAVLTTNGVATSTVCAFAATGVTDVIMRYNPSAASFGSVRECWMSVVPGARVSSFGGRSFRRLLSNK